MASTRIFGLRLKSGVLKVKKFELAETCADLGRRGAKLLQFSPDTKWLATIGADNSIHMYRRSETDEDRKSPIFSPTSVELKRLRRDTLNAKAKDTSLGNYNRSINRLTFSADSRILAVSDISGFLDTWVLEGQEDYAQGSYQQSNPADAADKSDSSDEEDSAEGGSSATVFGQHWIRNPAASLMTKLPATPLVLTFRPSSTQATATFSNGPIGVHPTRHNPYPQSHDLPKGEDRLFVLTAENQIYEFNVLSGTISDWSRRNPTSSLPKEFRDLKDRAKGAIWDLRYQHERIWLYGISWLWMFDLSRDLPTLDDGHESAPVTNGHSTELSLKRKRCDHDEASAASRPRIDTGAGSKICNSELGLGIGRKMWKLDGGDGAARQWTNLDGEQDLVSDEEGGYLLTSESEQALVKLRRGNIRSSGHMSNRRVENSTDADTSENDDTRFVKMGDGKRLAYWHTYKYRPILGIVPLMGGTDDAAAEDKVDDSSGSGPEVALVERPLFDVDLPPRYFGNQEWNP